MTYNKDIGRGRGERKASHLTGSKGDKIYGFTFLNSRSTTINIHAGPKIQHKHMAEISFPIVTKLVVKSSV